MENKTAEEKILAARLKLTQEILEHYDSIHNMINMVATGLEASLQKARFTKSENSCYTIDQNDFEEIFKKASSLRQNGWESMDSYGSTNDSLKAIRIKEGILKKLE